MKLRHLIKLALALTAICSVVFLRTAIAAEADLLTAIRDDDISAVRALRGCGVGDDRRPHRGPPADDQELLDRGMTLFESLYRTFDQASKQPRPRQVARPRATRKHRSR